MQYTARLIADEYAVSPNTFEGVYESRLTAHQEHKRRTNNAAAHAAAKRLVEALEDAWEVVKDGRGAELCEIKHLVPMNEIAEETRRRRVFAPESWARREG